MLQFNSTYHGATKAIPYEVVFNRKPNYKRVSIGLGQVDEDKFEKQDFKEQEIEDEQDTSLIRKSVDQEAIEERVRLQLDDLSRVEKEDHQEQATDGFNTGFDPNFEEAAVGEEETPESDTADPSTSPNRTLKEGLPVDPDLLSPQLDRLRLAHQENAEPQELYSTPTTALRQQVQINQKHANERTQRQYGKQRQVRTFELFDQVSVAVPALDRTSIDDERIFGRVIGLNPEYNCYQIVTKYGVLDRNYPTSELNPLPSEFDIGIPDPMPQTTVTLHYCAAQESTSEKVPVHCNCRDQKTWCSTRRCACIKAETKCSIACHGGTNQDNTPDCPNISSMRMRTQRGLQSRDQDGAKEAAKRQRHDRVGHWIASKGNDLVDNGGSSKRRNRRSNK